ncbi:hypothetical protein CHELA1G11_13039 [Hyphomicrobiales bacterium]|nr:hypothetical protein CHELA1G2_11271 [Hyphomicrobiales bacterium]CAH1668878.1 hypothetical protein CHELA1G11_13039 [Hyphomicrobiales bacterium]
MFRLLCSSADASFKSGIGNALFLAFDWSGGLVAGSFRLDLSVQSNDLRSLRWRCPVTLEKLE